MSNSVDSPLGAPPRKAHFRRGVRNVVRAYRTIFALVILVVGGWAALDLFRWRELDHSARWLTILLLFAVVIAIVVLRFVERPLHRELRLARRGIVVVGQVVAIKPAKRRRGFARLTFRYHFQGQADPIQATCRLSRRIQIESLAVGSEIEVLVDPAKPRLAKPRIAMGFVEFGPPSAAVG